MTSKGTCAISSQLEARARLATLNASESEALSFLLQNISTEAIARRLAINVSDVESYREKILVKLEVKSLLQALNLVDKAGRLSY